MARQPRHNVDYFPHLISRGKKMRIIQRKYGNDGYATWMKILEELGEKDYHYLDLNDELSVMDLADICLISEDKLFDIIDLLAKFDEIDRNLWDRYKIIWNDKFIESIQDAYKKRSSKCIDREGLILLLQEKGVISGSIYPQSTPGNTSNDTKTDQSGTGNTSEAVKSGQSTPGNPQRREEKSKEEKTKLKESKEEEKKEDQNFSFAPFENEVVEVVNFYQETTGKAVNINLYNIKEAARHLLTIGVEAERIKQVILFKTIQTQRKDLKGRPLWQKRWLEWKTLFEPVKFEKYSNEVNEYTTGDKSGFEEESKLERLRSESSGIEV